ncbi:hypothetical protein M569_12350, partial [Genlisea aurea]
MSSGEEAEAVTAAAARKERLRALKEAQELLSTPDENSTNGNADGLPDINMRFRNYIPHDKQLQEGKLVPHVLPKFEDPPQLAAAPASSEETKEDPFLRIAPKKPNWDLRRDVQKRIDKLDRRTQKALHKLM